MPYTHTTNGVLITQLAARLGDPNNIFWTFNELRAYVKEAIYLFNVLTGFWRRQGTFSTVVGQPFYDIRSIGTMGALLAFGTVDQEVIRLIQHHLLEPAPGNSWTGTGMFDLDDVTRALEHRRDQFLAETGILLTRTTPSAGGPPSSRVDLADTIIDLRRVAWTRDSDSTLSHLWREDEHALSAFDQSWLTATDPPIAYSVSATPPITLQLAPPASVAGTLDLIHVSTGAALDPSVGPTILGVPDFMAWVVKWGAMADLLGHEGEARDPRAGFCEERFRMGVELARNAVTIVHADIDGTPVLLDSLASLDAYRVNWQNAPNGTPDIVAVAGHNLVALSPPPDAIITITLDVVESSSRLDANFDNVNSFGLQIGREDLNGILDYAEHLAAFKMGGAEWELTTRQAEEFMSHAVLRNQLMEAGTRGSLANMFSLSRREEADRPRRVEVDA